MMYSVYVYVVYISVYVGISWTYKYCECIYVLCSILLYILSVYFIWAFSQYFLILYYIIHYYILYILYRRDKDIGKTGVK